MKIDFVIQGPYTDFTDAIIESYLKLPFLNRIIVSCWESDKSQSIFPDRVEFVRSQNYIGYPGPTNVNLQLTTSLAGVLKSTSNFVAKFRSDQIFDLDSVSEMYNFFVNNLEENKIFVVSNHFTLLFHPKDWVYWGYKNDMITLFDIPKEVNDECQSMGIHSKNYSYSMHLLTRPETYIGAYYCSNYNDDVKRMVMNQKEYLYDNAPKWNEAKILSDKITKKYFKSFPRKNITMSWPKKNINCMPFDPLTEGWDEEGY